MGGEGLLKTFWAYILEYHTRETYSHRDHPPLSWTSKIHYRLYIPFYWA